MDQTDKGAQWLAEAEAMRANLAEAGVAGRDALRSRSGMEFLKGIGSGALPPAPIAELLGITPISVEPGLTVFQGSPSLAHYNPSGVVRAEAKVVNLGGQVGIAEGRITDANGKL